VVARASPPRRSKRSWPGIRPCVRSRSCRCPTHDMGNKRAHSSLSPAGTSRHWRR
jgi:hypothetical protein